MKKLLLTVVAVLMASVSFAQYSVAPRVNDMTNFDGSQNSKDGVVWKMMGTPVAGTNIFDQSTIYVTDYLDQDMFVLLDFSCTWCGPCWYLHNSGLLEQMQALENYQVIWVEIETSNTTAQIYGEGSGTQGNWTLTPGGEQVPYPIIDDAGFLTPFRELYEGYVPTLMLVAPNGMFCNLDGHFSYNQVAASVQEIQNVAATYPQSGQAPTCSIDCASSVQVGSAAAFHANVVSYDPVTYSWTFENGTPATSAVADPTCTWNEEGIYEVTLTVTNDAGSATTTTNINVYSLEAGILSYAYGMPYASGIGTGSMSNVYWAAMYPTSMLTNYNILDHVEIYVPSSYPANYTVTIYEGGTDAPATQIYTSSINVTSSMGNNYVSYVPEETVYINNTENLWVVANAVQTYPMAGVSGTLDANGDWLSLDGSSWEHAADYNLNYTWMIDTYVKNDAGVVSLSKDNVAIYPNPTTGTLFINAESVQKVEVLDLNGRVIMSQNHGESVDMGNLGDGIYMLRIFTNEGVSMQKVVKEMK